MLTVASLFWEANEHSQWFSKCYTEDWVTRLYRGFERNLTLPWRFVLWTDRIREYPVEIKQELIRGKPDYGSCIEPYRYGVPMILVGLDTVIVGSIDHLAAYCLEKETIALPRDPYNRHQAANGVNLIPAGQQYVYRNWHGENDMVWMRQQKHVFIDDLFPGQVISYKGEVKQNGMDRARIVYFHGDEKPHQLMHLDWIRKHWVGDGPSTTC